ncbi:MAG: four helix bundle protein [Cloacibacterium normanense]
MPMKKIWINFSNKKAAISIPSNIAEGAGRNSNTVQSFLGIANGSSFELKHNFF